MIKKGMMGMGIGIITLGAIYGYFLFIGNAAAVGERIQANPVAALIFFLSIVAIYVCQGGDKLAKRCMIIIILGDLFLIGDMFFRNTIGLDKMHYTMLFGLLIIAFGITYIKHRIRYFLITIILVGIAFVMGTGMLPLYENIPNINDFILSQKSRVIKLGSSDQGIVTIKNMLGKKDIPIGSLQQDDIDLTEKMQISYAAPTQSGSSKIFIDIGNGAFISISPQSAITLEQSGADTVMEIVEGDIEYYTPPAFSGALKLIGKYSGKNIQDIKNSIRADMVDQFQKKKEEFFIKQIGGNMILNPVVDKIIQFFLKALSTINPKAYEQNMKNYEIIQGYLSGSMPTEGTSSITGSDLRNMIDSLMSQVKKGTEETTVLKKVFER